VGETAALSLVGRCARQLADASAGIPAGIFGGAFWRSKQIMEDLCRSFSRGRRGRFDLGVREEAVARGGFPENSLSQGAISLLHFGDFPRRRFLDRPFVDDRFPRAALVLGGDSAGAEPPFSFWRLRLLC
jgi:hypothetical protein